MNPHDILFWFFSIAMLLCGVLVIANRNPIHSALALVMLFVCMAGLFVLLEAFFLAAIQVRRSAPEVRVRWQKPLDDHLAHAEIRSQVGARRHFPIVSLVLQYF